MEMMTIGTAVFSGGSSSRMGQDKALLTIGTDTFLEHLIREMNPFPSSLYLSVGKGRRYPLKLEAEARMAKILYVEDRYDNCGPLGGLHALLEACAEDALFVTTVDLPFTDRILREELLSYLMPGIDAVVPIDPDGRMHPLCAIYRKNCLPLLVHQLESGNYRMRDFLTLLQTSFVPVTKLTDGCRKLDNINTPEDYRRISQRFVSSIETNRFGIPILSLTAYSGSGKTTFLEQLIRELKARGVRLAVVKHDGHDFDIDRPQKDSWRFAKAGADAVILSSSTKTAILQYFPREITAVVDEISGMDLILIEGLKHGPYPKLMLYRCDAQKPPAIQFDRELPRLIISDKTDWGSISCPRIGLNDIPDAADFCEAVIRQKRRKS